MVWFSEEGASKLFRVWRDCSARVPPVVRSPGERLTRACP